MTIEALQEKSNKGTVKIFTGKKKWLKSKVLGLRNMQKLLSACKGKYYIYKD